MRVADVRPRYSLVKNRMLHKHDRVVMGQLYYYLFKKKCYNMFFGVSMTHFFLCPCLYFSGTRQCLAYVFGNDVTITIRAYTFIVFIALIEFFDAFKM